jgi:hypothetical protein
MLDFAAPRACKIALKQGLELEHERVLRLAAQALAGYVLRDGNLLLEGHTHGFLPSGLVPDVILSAVEGRHPIARAIVGKR